MSLVLTLCQNLISKYSGATDKNEIRASRYGAWDFFQKQTGLASGILDAQTKANVMKSFGNTVQIPVLDNRTVTIGNTRSCTVADSENTSKLITLTFATYSFGFTMTPAQHYNNMIAYQQDFDKKLELYLLKLAATLDTAAVAKLATDKNQHFPAAITAYYAATANALQVPLAGHNDFYNNLSAIQEEMDFYGKLNIISSTSGQPMLNRLKAQGGGNDENDAFQFGGYEWNFTNRLTNGAGVKSTLYAIPDGNVAVVNRNDPDAIAGSSVGNGAKQWGIANMPLVNMDMATYYYEDCADKSALHAGTSGLTRTKVEGFEFSTDVCFVSAYNSVPATTFSPILKAELLSA